MKYIKMLGLAALATALMAVAASTASATVLKEETSNGVVHTLAAPIPLNSSLQAGTSALLTDTNNNTIETCTTSSVEGELTKAGSATTTASGPVKHLTFGGEGCAVTVTQALNGTLELHHKAGTTNGTVTGSGFHVAIHVFGVTCTYGLGANTDLGELTGTRSTAGEAKFPTLHINTIVLLQTGGFLCPPSGKWVATYDVTTEGLHVEAS